MTSGAVTLLAGYFTFIFAGVSIVGYFWTSKRTSPESKPGAGRPRFRDVWFRMLENLGRTVLHRRLRTDTTRKLLLYAGYRSPAAESVFEGARVASLTVVAGLSLWGAMGWLHGVFSIVTATLVGAILGYSIPERVLAAIISQRSSRLRAALPAALDIWALGIEAGQPLEGAIADSSRELRSVYPELSAELALVLNEVRAGKSRAEALDALAARNREPELKKVCKLVMDGERFGVSLAPALRNHARFLRIRSRLKAQEAARKVSVKLVFPVFFLIFPAVILVTLGPAIIRIANLFETLTQAR